MWRSRTAVTGLLVGLAVALAAGSPAAAGGSAPPPAVARAIDAPPVVWRTATCATGTLESIFAHPDGYLVLTGTATVCDPAEAGRQFNVGLFRKNRYFGAAIPENLTPYEADGPTAVKVGLLPNVVDAAAVCLLSSPTTRLACAEIVTDPAGAAEPTLLPIPVDDPLVKRAVIMPEQEGPRPPFDTDGFCGTCV